MDKRWSVDWYSFMVSHHGYVVIMVDVSGSGYNGDQAMTTSVHRRIGELETRDILHIIRSITTLIFSFLGVESLLSVIKLD